MKSTNPYVTSRIRMSYLVGTSGVRLRFWTRRAPVTLGELQRHGLGRVLNAFATELDPPAATSSGTFAAGEVMAAGPNPAATDGAGDRFGQGGGGLFAVEQSSNGLAPAC